MSKRTPRGGTTAHRRRSGRVRIHAQSPSDRRTPGPPEGLVGWVLAAAGAGAVAAAAGWIIIAGLSVIGWLPGDGAPLSAVFTLGSHLWLLGHGAHISLAGLPVSLVPLGISVLGWVIVRGAAGVAARQAVLADPRTRDSWRARTAAAGRVAGLLVATYLLIVVVVAAVTGALGLRLLLGTLLLSGSAAVVGVVSGAGLDLLSLLPIWARPIPRAVLASQLVVLAGAATALTLSLALNRERVGDLESQIADGPTAVAGLTALQLAFLPTLVVWAASWVLGAGFSMGDGTIVSPADTQLGLLPAVPITGALPPEGPGLSGYFAWLAVGVVAGAVAAALVVRARPRARFDETALVGGLAGLLSGLVIPLISLVARGDFGSNRLVGLGPRVADLLVVAPALLGLSGMAVGLVWGLVRRPAP
ncbi:MAG TPA: hypothetical protein IAA98_12160 [Candidatus Avipropionibacterium avicola]|uniref:Uncharacterized protein n=1 Tax=Candidatus Avipropionibacterium avicola TaxID=2840701 RepID=A0A9D1H1E9_9ACTN|nr:hypothetical protein [Candidatus Avipropionibacterium avicola]